MRKAGVIRILRRLDRTSPTFGTDFPPVVEMSPEVVSGEVERGVGGPTPSGLSVGLAQRTRELSRSTRVQSIAARQTGIVTTTKSENQA